VNNLKDTVNNDGLRVLLSHTIKEIEKTGDFIMRNLHAVIQADIHEKSLNSLVSYVDQESERMLVEAFKKILPEAGFITEENTIQQVDSEYKWIIDPLDGTTNYLHKIPCFAISVALLRDNQPIMGIVKELNRNECFYALSGQGAYLNDAPIHVSLQKPFEEVLVATGFPYESEDEIDFYLSLLREFQLKSRGIRRLGSAAVDLAYTACGRFGAYYESKLNPWDVAAGALIVQEAEGIVSDYSGTAQHIWNGEIVACAPQYHDYILSTIQLIKNKC
jgi:myo-inositol-1(or 4)-monophosphatase